MYAYTALPESFDEQLGDRVTKRLKSYEQRRRRTYP